MRIRKIVVWIHILMCACAYVYAETDDAVVAVVNGENLMLADVEAYAEQYYTTYEANGYDVENESVQEYIFDAAMSAMIESMLVKQDMKTQGMFDFEDETEFRQKGAEAFALIREQITAEFEATINAYNEQLGKTDVDLTPYVDQVIADYGYSEESMTEYYKEQAALERYYAHLMQDEEFTDDDVQAYYNAAVEADKSAYENNIAAYETDLMNGEDVWYVPEGYRAYLQILLAPEGEDNASRLANAQADIDKIMSKLEAGESFENLIAEFGQDANFDDPEFLEEGYHIHSDSVTWAEEVVAAAYSESMQTVGSVSEPFAGETGVHILYYLKDVEGGAVELTAELSETIRSYLYSARLSELLNTKIDQLAEQAEVEIVG